ncbi:MAG TPA: hypothetical protein VGZ47_14010 [Gemmataceae bacterium]|jgi:hypothetical protein|nr:hypothetical protein [Gemmataceae bacterium]
MNRFILCVGVILLPAIMTQCRADDSKPQAGDAAIEKVVADSLAAGQKMDWQAYAELVHPESLQEYKTMWLPALQAAARERPEKQADLLSAFDKAPDLKTVISLKPKELFVSSMKGMAAQFPQWKADASKAEQKIIGTVHEGDDKAYVVVRTITKFGRADMTKVEVIALKRSGAEWKIMLPDVVRTMADTIRRTGQDVQKSGPVQDLPKPDK